MTERAGPNDAAARVERAVGGDKDALEELLRELEPELRARIRVQPVWRRSIEVDDIVQVTCLEAFLRIGTLQQRTRAGLASWLARIAANNLRDAVRALEADKRPDAHRRVTHAPGGQSARTLLGAVIGTDATAGGRAALEEQLERLRGAIEKLPRSYRTVVQSMDLAERSVGEVAEEMGRSRGAVHLLRARAHTRLAELLR